MFKICQVCGKGFESAPAARRKFCSRTCMGVAKVTRVQRTCKRCGKEFSARLYKVKEGKARFCSHACAYGGWTEPCQNCGKPVHRHPYHAQTQEHCFCSRKCYHDWCDQRVTQVCQHCGAEFQIKRSEIAKGGGKHCSPACYNATRAQQSATFVCEQCSKPFERPAHFLHWRTHRRKYCSIACAGLARRLPDATHSEYNCEFTETLKEQIRQRDNYTCQLCGVHQTDSRRAFTCHHVDYNKANNHPENLITLCDSCHGKTNYNREHWRMLLSVAIH